MVKGILTFSNNKNVIAIGCSDAGNARYQLFRKTDK